jgi:hypothetical protein
MISRLSTSDVREYLSRGSNRGWITTTLRFVFLGGLFVVGAWFVYFAGVTLFSRFPLEYREGAPLVLTQLLLDGRNPFSLENQPLGMNNYGIVYNLAALPLAAVFGNTLLIHRVITLAFILLCFVLVFWTAFISSNNVGAAIACGELVVIALAARAGLGAFPSSMGAFFFLTAVLLPFNRSFDRRGLVLSALLCLLAFYTKPYFVLAFGIVASYVFLFVSKNRALFYGLLFVIAFCLSFLLVKFIFPLYFFDTVVSNLAQASRAQPVFLYDQLNELVVEFYPGMISGLIIAWVGMRGWPFKNPLARFNFRSLDRPVVSKRLDYFAYCFFCSTLAFIFILGTQPGNFMSYAYQLMLPPFFLWLFQELKPQSRLGLILLPVLLFNLASFCLTGLNPSLLTQSDKSRKAWARLYQLAGNSSHILNSPILVPEMMRLGTWPVDSGHTEYYFRLGGRPENALLGPGYDIIESDGQRYLDSIRAAVVNQQFDRIIVTDQHDYFYDYELISQYYQQITTFSLDMPQANQNWHVVVWVPIQK